MTQRLYKVFQAVFFSVFIPIFLLNQFGDRIDWLVHHPSIALSVFYAKPILSLTLLYFGVYARMSNMQNVPKWGGPTSIIIGGCLFTLVSFGPPIMSFLLIHDSRIEALPASKLELIKKTALDLNEKIESRLTAARYYYWQTGNSIDYREKNGTRNLYFPSEADKQERKKHVEMVRHTAGMVSQSKAIAVRLLVLLVGSLVGFFIFVKWKPPEKRKSDT